MKESNLWKWLSKARDEAGDDLNMNRVENVVMAGMPDVEGCYLGAQFWIELKVADRPARASTPVRPKIRKEQIDFANDRVKAGGFSWFLVQVGSGSDRAVYLIPGLFGELIAEGLPESELALHSALVNPKATPLTVIRTATQDRENDRNGYFKRKAGNQART